MNSLFRIACIFFIVLICSCDSVDQNTLEVANTALQKDVLTAEEMQRFNREVNSPDAIGIRGVFNVPEMLSVVVLDSAPLNLVAQKRVKAFTQIESDIKEIGAQIDGSPGSIYYNNDPDNFKFECLMLIRNLPKVNPRNSRIVVLEASSMLIYNHKGAYSNLNTSYARIKAYNDSCQLEQTGPMREFYIVSPLETPDSSAWLTRIMVPVAKIQK